MFEKLKGGEKSWRGGRDTQQLILGNDESKIPIELY